MAGQEITDVLGSRGENLFCLAITDYKDFPRPLFRPFFLGDKCPDVDFLVRLSDAPGIFFVQVKATAVPMTRLSIKLRVTNEKRKLLSKLPGPTYIVGVHEPSKRCFIRAVHADTTSGITSILLANELNSTNLQVLFDEVKAFWSANAYKPHHSAFS